MALLLLQGGSSSSQDDDDDDITFHELNLMAAGGWTSPDDNERQISLREESSDSSFRSMRPELPPPLPPLNPPHDHFLMTTSFSLPASPSTKKIQTKSRRMMLNYKDPVDDHNMERSKSCGEGRWCSPPDDILFALPAPPPPCTNTLVLPPDDRSNKAAAGCGALCLYLPGFGKGSKVTRRREVVGSSRIGSVISRTVSLERFECGSWASINYMSEMDRNHQNSLYFDLPIEMIRSSSVDDDTSNPVASAFLFDTVVKSNSKSQQVRPSRFSGQPREDFDALLHAHNHNII